MAEGLLLSLSGLVSLHVDRKGGTESFCSSMHLKYKGIETVAVISVERFAAKVYRTS